MFEFSRPGLALLAGIVFAGTAIGQDAPAAPEEAPPPEPVGFFDGWDGSVSLGVLGTSGNTEIFTFNSQIDGLRKSKAHETSFIAKYTRAQGETRPNGSGELANRAEIRGRNDFIFTDSKWFAFAEGVYEYDEFQDWSSRVQLFAGPGYVWTDTERTTFKTRAGVGVIREFLGSDNRARAEAILSADLRHKLTERQNLTAVLDVFPDLTNVNLYRGRLRVQWEIVVDPEVNLTLKLGFEDRYDMDPGPDSFTGGSLKRNDIEYFALLGWSF